MTIKLAIFDLDGTLVDSLDDIGGAMNHALAHHGLPPHPLDAYRQFVGEGARRLAERALPADRQDLRDSVLAEYHRFYAENLLVKTRPYPGIEELLEALAARGVALAVLSNKPDPATRKLVGHFFSRWPLKAVFGERAGVPRKPDPAAALEIAALMGARPQECLFVGDSGIDMKTAHQAGMVAVGVLWGLRGREELLSSGARVLVEQPREILALAEV